MSYKLPICWLGKSVEELDGSGMPSSRVITESDVDQSCQCFTALQAHFCMQGHMTECHAGMTCSEAECSHWEADQEHYPDDLDL